MRASLLLVALFACLAQPAQAQRIRPQIVPYAVLPSGSYSQSCVDIVFDGNTLTATCRTRAGAMERNLGLFVAYCASNSDISNLDGVLHCVAIPGTYGVGYAMPGGAYWQTCDARRTVVGLLHNNILSYQCRDRTNRFVDGVLDMSACDMRYGIVNANGNLVCGSNPRQRLSRPAITRGG